jgi:galactokinase
VVHILRSFDIRSLSYQNLPLPERHALIVIDSGVPHGHAGGEYPAGRGCEEAAHAPGVASLRDATMQALEKAAYPKCSGAARDM